MRTRFLHIVSMVMAVLILSTSVGRSTNFHYCTEDCQIMGGFGDAAQFCDHCKSHTHQHISNIEQHHWEVTQFNNKCCCEDFNSKDQFSDDYIFSPEKSYSIFLDAIVIPYSHNEQLVPIVQSGSCCRVIWKNPVPLSGRQIKILLSDLRLAPSIF